MVAFVVFIGVLGVVVGSFLNVVALRVPEGETLLGRSHCPSCGATLTALDLVPVFSWLALRGHCRHCSAPVSSTYAVVEATSGALFAGLAAHFGRHPVLAPYLILAAGLLALSAVDLRTFRLPDRIVGPLTVLVVAAFGLVAAVDGAGDTFLRALAGGLALALGFGALHLAFPTGLGFGDVKLAFVLGVATGWVSWGCVSLSVFLAAVLGLIVGIGGALIQGQAIRRRRIPFGPFLAAGALLASVAGPSILDWYSRLGR